MSTKEQHRDEAIRERGSQATPPVGPFHWGHVMSKASVHVGAFARLEDELCGLIAGGGYEGPGRSPDRADACVWALTDLMLRGRAAVPRVRVI